MDISVRQEVCIKYSKPIRVAPKDIVEKRDINPERRNTDQFEEL